MTDVRVVTEFPRRPTVREGVWIPLADGTRLAARIWLPDDAESDPVPAVLEYLPYRLNDGTASGDHQQMTWFAGHGYAGVRVDIRGTGESGGHYLDEYTVQEQEDGEEVIAWLAAQPWCTGAVGMMGYSWSGFNALQLAARRPPALKAIVTAYASDDRYADDVHYRGGLVLPMDMAHWATCMLAFNAVPPDPAVVGEGWREQWLERLDRTPPFIEHWLAHQRRDEYWRQGSVRDDPTAIEIPVMAVAGWTDGYRDAALRLLEDLDVPRRALIGPWGHGDPVHGNPGPSVGILSEYVRWWDRWLKGEPNGIEDEPALVAWMQEPVAPAANLAQRPGRWVAEAEWPSPFVTMTPFALGDGSLGEDAPVAGRAAVGSVQTVGMEGGAWCADGQSADLPLDQRGEDGQSLTFDSAPLSEPLEMLGIGEARLRLASDRPLALVSVRVNEVQADGSVLLVTRGQLNLAHRASHAEPEPLEPGEAYDVTVTLDSIAHRFAAGSRLRMSLSPCYWPLAWPSPEPVTLTLTWGDGQALVLPVRAARDEGDGPARQPDEPAEPEPYETQTLVSGVGSRSISRDLTTGRAELRFDWDLGGRQLLVPSGLTMEETAIARYSIVVGDPLSAEVEVEVPFALGRGDGWQTSGRAWARMTCTADAFLVTTTLDCYEGSSRVWARAWSFEFPRDHG